MRHRNLQGADLHAPSAETVENNTLASLPSLAVVTFDGIGTLYPAVRPAVGNVDIVRGVVQNQIPSGAVGKVHAIGFVAGVNTSAWAVGTTLYCSATGQLISTIYGLPVAVVLKSDATVGVLYVNAIGITQNALLAISFPPEAELDFMYSNSFPRPFKEFTYDSNGDILSFDTYATPAKVIHILNKTFAYTSGNLTSIVTTNILTGLSKTRTITYNAGGQMISETEV